MARIPDEAVKPLSQEMFLATRNRSVVPLDYDHGVALEEGEFDAADEHEAQQKVLPGFPEMDGPVV